MAPPIRLDCAERSPLAPGGQEALQRAPASTKPRFQILDGQRSKGGLPELTVWLTITQLADWFPRRAAPKNESGVL